MAIDLTTKYLPYTDELFFTESKKALLTNQDFDWDGAHSIKVYRVTTTEMNDYGRTGPKPGVWSRYGPIESLDATTQSMTLRKDRSFTFAIDKLDTDETAQQLAAAGALARQLREVVIPEVDAWTYAQMCANAGQSKIGALTPDNVYDAIIAGSNALDNAEVPDTGRVLMITPDTFLIMKTDKRIVMETNIGNEMRIRGVIGELDGMAVVKVPAARLPEDFGFMIAYPGATVAPTKLADYKIHLDAPGISGSLVEGRINYDAFVLDNKKDGLYYHKSAEAED